MAIAAKRRRLPGRCQKRAALALSAAALLIAIAGAPAMAGGGIAQCRGDCNDDGTVAVNELIRGVQIALGELNVEACAALDTSGDAAVQLFELIGAVNSALAGCAGASPTVTPVVTGTASNSSPTASASPTRSIASATPPASPTRTPIGNATRTAVATAAGTATATPDAGQSATAAATATATASARASQSAVATPTAAVPSATQAPTGTATASGTVTQTGTPTSTPTPADTPTSTASPTPVAVGPAITYFGVARANGSITQPVGAAADGTPIYERRLPQGFFLVIEAKPGLANRAVATSTFNSVPGDPNALPDLQIVVSRSLGNGSAMVCDAGPFEPIGGVPAIDPPIFGGSQASANAVNDLSCRFTARTSGTDGGQSAGPCTRNANGDGAFVDSTTRVQFCPTSGIGSEVAFAPGDTRVTARVTDVLGEPGPPASIIVRVVAE